MPSVIATIPKYQFSNSIGYPLVNGTLTVYLAGTVTPTNTWQDSALTILNTNPVVLDSRGECILWLDSNINYKFVLKDSGGIVQWTVDNIVGSSSYAYTLEVLLAAAAGSSKVGFLQAGTGAVPTTMQSKAREVVSVKDFGAVGDGVTLDDAAFAAMFATGQPWTIPYTSAGYLISSTKTINSDGVCNGFIVPTVAVGFTPVFVIADSGYAIKRKVTGLSVRGSVALRTAQVIGIRVDCPNAHLINCTANQLNYGIVVRMYSVTLTKCSAWQCNTNLSGYARDFTHEINALTIDGGNYDSAVNVAINLGDTSWIDALAAGNYHGVVINIIGAVNTDGAESRIDNCGSVNIIGTYAETSNTDCLWRIGGTGDGNCANITINGNFLKNAKYAIRCYSGVKNLKVGPNFLSAIMISEVKLSTDIYGVKHHVGEYAGCFGNGQVVGISFRSLPLSLIDFANFTLDFDYLINGSYQSNVYPKKWYPTTIYQSFQTKSSNIDSFVSKGVFYSTPSLVKAGSAVSNVFTFTNKADCYAFNGGDRITCSPASATYIRSVDWDLGTALLDGGSIANGAMTISQIAPYIVSTTYTLSIPTTGTWNLGDISFNFTPAIGQPKAWTCTVAGTPGTWVSQGNL